MSISCNEELVAKDPNPGVNEGVGEKETRKERELLSSNCGLLGMECTR